MYLRIKKVPIQYKPIKTPKQAQLKAHYVPCFVKEKKKQTINLVLIKNFRN